MKVSDLFKRKKVIIAIVSVVVAVIAITVGTLIYSHRQVSLTNDIEVKFRGYNKSGTIDYNSEKINKKINSLYAKRSGLSKYQVQQVLDDPSYVKELPSKLQDKGVNVANWGQELVLRFDHESGLKNGQIVKATVTNGNDKENPIKETSKKYKVAGLKPVKLISTKKQLNSIKTNFSGYNGEGIVQINSSSQLLDNQEVTVKHNGKLSNGDKVTLNFKDAFPKRKGKEWTGKEKLEVTVSGLKDLSKISNVDEVKAMTDRVAKDDADSSTKNSFDDKKYTATFVSLYAQQDDDLTAASYRDTPQYAIINENDDAAAENDDLKVRVVGLYKKESSDTSEDDVYEKVTLNEIPLQGNKLYLDRIKADTTGNLSEDYTNDSLETIDHNLAANSVKLK